MICDFGLSKHILQSPDTTDDSVLLDGGTIRWMAKELLEISKVSVVTRPDQMSDIWALGMVIYVCMLSIDEQLVSRHTPNLTCLI